jgi:hypothetical protein
MMRLDEEGNLEISVYEPELIVAYENLEGRKESD